MAKKIIVVRVGEQETQIVHIEHSSSNPTVYGCVRFSTPEKAVQDGMIVDMAELAVHIHKACIEICIFLCDTGKTERGRRGK